ncbi:MAG: hypothetical protein DI585_00805 [Pseudomonas fluorescens]|nr:MAG: hypothetical protein DI585_00805 [Pseudomonas fluorescens]
MAKVQYMESSTDQTRRGRKLTLVHSAPEMARTPNNQLNNLLFGDTAFKVPEAPVPKLVNADADQS